MTITQKELLDCKEIILQRNKEQREEKYKSLIFSNTLKKKIQFQS